MKRIIQTCLQRAVRTALRAGIASVLATAAWAQLPQPTLTVDGNPVITARPVTRIGDEWFLPLLPIARALGVDVAVSAEQQELRAKRPDGMEVHYNGRTGEIRSGHALVGRIQAYQQVQIIAPNDDLLFPLSGVVALLGVAIQEDLDGNVLRIESSRADPQGGPAITSMVSLSDLEYDYGLTTNMEDSSQFLGLRGGGVSGAARLRGNALVSKYPGRPVNLIQGSLRAEFSQGRAFIFGDQSTYAGLEAHTTTVRGIGLEERVRGFQAHFYGGRSVGVTFASLGGGFPRYDTEIAGFSLRRKAKTDDLVIAGHYFDGSDRSGTSLGIGYGRSDTRNHFRAQLLLGEFSGLSSRSVLVRAGEGEAAEIRTPGLQAPGGSAVEAGSSSHGSALPVQEEWKRIRVSGPAAGLTLADTFTPVRQLTLSARFDRYGKNYLTPREDARFNAQSNKAVAFVFRPSSFASVNGGVSERSYIAGDPARLRSYNFGALASLPGRHAVQLGFFHSVQSDSASRLGRMTLNQYSVTVPGWGRFSGYAYYSEMGFGGERARSLSTAVALDLRRRGRITAHSQLQFGQSHRFGVDWHLEIPEGGSYLRFGVDRQSSPRAEAVWLPLVGVKLPLPRRQSLELSYLADRETHMFRVELGGSLIRSRDLTRSDSGPSAVIIPSPLTGRVYLDADLDGSYDPAVDRPIRDIRVWLDDADCAVTDGQGIFRFDRVGPGAHRITAGLDGVPADMVFAGAADRTIAVIPHRNNTLDFGIVRTGRISGKVSYLDYSMNPEEPVERPLPDARIVAGSSRDAYSEANGRFLLGDLSPGTYQLKLDPSTLPGGYVPNPATQTVEVLSGLTVADISFLLVYPPKPLIEKVLPASMAPAPPPREPLPPPSEEAEEQDMVPPGIADLPAPPSPAPETRPAERGSPAGPFKAQVFASKVSAEAREKAEMIRRAGLDPEIRRMPGEDGLWYRVGVGGFESCEAASAAVQDLVNRKLIKDYWVLPQ